MNQSMKAPPPTLLSSFAWSYRPCSVKVQTDVPIPQSITPKHRAWPWAWPNLNGSVSTEHYHEGLEHINRHCHLSLTWYNGEHIHTTACFEARIRIRAVHVNKSYAAAHQTVEALHELSQEWSALPTKHGFILVGGASELAQVLISSVKRAREIVGWKARPVGMHRALCMACVLVSDSAHAQLVEVVEFKWLPCTVQLNKPNTAESAQWIQIRC